MKKYFTISRCIVTLYIYLLSTFSCKEKPVIDRSPEDDPIVPGSIRGKIILPEKLTFNISNLVVSSIIDTAHTRPNGSFNISLLEEQETGMLFVNDFVTDHILLMSYINKADEKIEITTESTALAILMTHPLIMSLNAIGERSALLYFKQHPDFPSLVREVETVILQKKDIFSPENKMLINIVNKIHLSASRARIQQSSSTQALFDKVSISFQPGGIKFSNYSWATYAVGIYDEEDKKIIDLKLPGRELESNVFAGAGKAFEYILRNPSQIDDCLKYIHDYAVPSTITPLCPDGPASVFNLKISEDIIFSMTGRKKVKIRATNGFYGLSNEFFGISKKDSKLENIRSEDRTALIANLLNLTDHLSNFLGIGLSSVIKRIKCIDATSLLEMEEKIYLKSRDFFSRQESSSALKGSELVYYIIGEYIQVVGELIDNLNTDCAQKPSLRLTIKNVSKRSIFLRFLTATETIADGINIKLLLESLAYETSGFDRVVENNDSKLSWGISTPNNLRGFWKGTVKSPSNVYLPVLFDFEFSGIWQSKTGMPCSWCGSAAGPDPKGGYYTMKNGETVAVWAGGYLVASPFDTNNCPSGGCLMEMKQIGVNLYIRIRSNGEMEIIKPTTPFTVFKGKYSFADHTIYLTDDKGNIYNLNK